MKRAHVCARLIFAIKSKFSLIALDFHLVLYLVKYPNLGHKTLMKFSHNWKCKITFPRVVDKRGFKNNYTPPRGMCDVTRYPGDQW